MTGAVLRVGRKVGRTLYVQRGTEPSDDDQLVGMVEDRVLAYALATAFNEHHNDGERDYLLGRFLAAASDGRSDERN